MLSEEKELFKAGAESGFIFDLGSSKSSIKLETGELNLDGAEMKYRDGEGNEITKEQFQELRIAKLEEKVDRILELLEGKELSTSFEKDLVSTAKKIGEDIDQRNNERWKKEFSERLDEIIPSSLSQIQADLNKIASR